MNIIYKNPQKFNFLDHQENNNNEQKNKIDNKSKTLIFKIIKDLDGVTVKITYDYANNYTNNNNDNNDNELNYEMCQINIDLSNFKDFGLEDYHRLSLKCNITEIVNKLNNEDDTTLKEYYIIFYN